MDPLAPLTGPALAQALWDRGLAPQGTTCLTHRDGPTYYKANGARWEPWRSIGDVWYLVLRYRLEVRWCPPGLTDHLAQVWPLRGSECEIAWAENDIGPAIARLALRLAEQTGEGA